MSKGKYKRKRERHHNAVQQQSPDGGLLECKQQAKEPHPRQGARENKKEPSMSFGERFRELWKQCSLTDQIIAFFTGILAAASIYQFILMGSQLDTMRKDQRPWIKVTFSLGALQTLAPIGGAIHLVNNGKTPARGIVKGDFVVERVKNGEQPKLDYPLPHTRFTTGMITPNDTPQDVAIERMRSIDNTVEIDPLMASELEDFNQVRIFFVVYGTVHYSDFFGTDHWTRFCTVVLPSNPPPNSSMTGQSCTKYSDVDSN
jgi:hypothetical protein